VLERVLTIQIEGTRYIVKVHNYKLKVHKYKLKVHKYKLKVPGVHKYKLKVHNTSKLPTFLMELSHELDWAFDDIDTV
jgi:hypothetical protein